MKKSTPSPNALVVGDAQHPLLVVQTYLDEAVHTRPSVTLSQRQIAALSALLQHVPGMTMGATQALTQTYLLRFAPDVTQQLMNGSATIMKSLEGGIRATAVDPHGKIISVGTLVATSGLNVAGVALAAWQVLAVVTAQHYLADISSRLAALEAGVEAIKQRLEDADVASLITDFKQLKVIYATIMDGQLSEPELTNLLVQVDSIDRTSSRIAETFYRTMTRETRALGNINMTGWFDPAMEIARAKPHVYAHGHASQCCLIAAAVRAAAIVVRCALPGERIAGQHRLDAVQSDLEQTHAAIQSFAQLAERKARNAGAYWDIKFWEQKNDYRRRLLRPARDNYSVLEAIHTDIAQTLADTQARLQVQIAAQDQALKLVVERNASGQITCVSQLVAIG